MLFLHSSCILLVTNPFCHCCGNQVGPVSMDTSSLFLKVRPARDFSQWGFSTSLWWFPSPPTHRHPTPELFSGWPEILSAADPTVPTGTFPLWFTSFLSTPVFSRIFSSLFHAFLLHRDPVLGAPPKSIPLRDKSWTLRSVCQLHKERINIYVCGYIHKHCQG